MRFFRKSDFLKVGGFDNTLIAAEDWDLSRRLSKLGKFTELDVYVWHYEDEDINLSDYTNKMKYYSKNIMHYVWKYGKDDPIVKKQLSVWYRIRFILFTKGSFWKMLFHPILTINMIYLKCISYFILNKYK